MKENNMTKELEGIFLDGLEENKNKLFRICSIYSKEPEGAKDLFQEVLVNIWQALPSFNAKSSIGTWMFRITLNVCLRLHSSYKKKRSIFIATDSVILENLSISTEPAEQNVQLEKLRQCVKALNEADKSIISLYLEELPYKDISEITGLSENNIAVKIKRIKSKLLKCMSQSL